MTIEIRKPGRTYWDKVGTAKIAKNGKWSYRYTPKLGGKFYIRARYESSAKLSRTASLTVRRGPGTKTVILLASTTSTRDSGLFERLGPAFLAACPEYTLKGTFVGSGAAIALGGSGDADVLLTHSPAAEVDFMNGVVAGKPSAYKGLTRYKVMYNDYVLVGPTSNPAGVGAGTAAGAFSGYRNQALHLLVPQRQERYQREGEGDLEVDRQPAAGRQRLVQGVRHDGHGSGACNRQRRRDGWLHAV